MRRKGQRLEQRQRGNEAVRYGKAVPDGRSSSWEGSGTSSGKTAGRDGEEPGALQEEEGGRNTRSGRQSGSSAQKIVKPRLRILCHRTLCSWFTPLRNCEVVTERSVQLGQSVTSLEGTLPWSGEDKQGSSRSSLRDGVRAGPWGGTCSLCRWAEWDETSRFQ